MPEAPSFTPRALLEHPDDFGLEADATWRFARSLDEAICLNRAIDQHTQALGVGRLLRRRRNSIADLAGAIGQRPETLASKLRGRRPAPEADLVVWSWLTGAARRHPPLGELVQLPGDGDPASLLPELPRPARRGQPGRTVEAGRHD